MFTSKHPPGPTNRREQVVKVGLREFLWRPAKPSLWVNNRFVTLNKCLNINFTYYIMIIIERELYLLWFCLWMLIALDFIAVRNSFDYYYIEIWKIIFFYYYFISVVGEPLSIETKLNVCEIATFNIWILKYLKMLLYFSKLYDTFWFIVKMDI